MRHSLFFVIFILISTNCNNDPTALSLVSSPETWAMCDAGIPKIGSHIIFNSLDDGTVAVDGKWKYLYWSDTVTCIFLSGSATINGTLVNINLSGTSIYPPDSANYVEASPFTMTMDGTFSKGKAEGIWHISFAKDNWKNRGTDGGFKGTLLQGQGITK